MPDRTITIDRDIRAERRAEAELLRQTFAAKGTLVVNLVSSPGEGKTSLLEATSRHWNGRWKMAVLVGDLAEHLRVVLLSTTEGDDKPGKYPKMFRTSKLMLVTKTDLLPHVPFSVEAAAADARLIQADMDVLPVCSTSSDGIPQWGDYLERQRDGLLKHHS